MCVTWHGGKARDQFPAFVRKSHSEVPHARATSTHSARARSADVAAFIHSTNERRDLTASQRAMIAAKVANISNGQIGGGHGRQVGDTADLTTQAEAAAALNVPERTVRAAKAVLDHDHSRRVGSVRARACK